MSGRTNEYLEFPFLDIPECTTRINEFYKTKRWRWRAPRRAGAITRPWAEPLIRLNARHSDSLHRYRSRTPHPPARLSIISYTSTSSLAPRNPIRVSYQPWHRHFVLVRMADVMYFAYANVWCHCAWMLPHFPPILRRVPRLSGYASFLPR